MLNEDWLPLWKAHHVGRHLRRHLRGHGLGWLPGGRGFGFWAGGLTVRRGDMKYPVLELLAEGPRHGYQIIRDLEERNEGYRASPGSVYPTLQMLEDGGFVSSETVDGKRVTRSPTRVAPCSPSAARMPRATRTSVKDAFPFAQLRDAASKLGVAAMQRSRR